MFFLEYLTANLNKKIRIFGAWLLKIVEKMSEPTMVYARLFIFLDYPAKNLLQKCKVEIYSDDLF